MKSIDIAWSPTYHKLMIRRSTNDKNKYTAQSSLLDSREKLADFYRKIVDMNDSYSGGWSQYYHGVVTRVIRENNYKRVAEIGVAYGTHAKEILRSTDIDQLYLIDSMIEHSGAFSDDIMSKEPIIKGNQFNELFDLVNKELSPWLSRFTFFRAHSLSITNEQIPDESLDCIFVDADHSYSAVLADLTFWWKKLRIGGQLLGDDFWIDDVRRAVDTFSSTHNVTYDFLSREGTSYKIYRFHK